MANDCAYIRWSAGRWRGRRRRVAVAVLSAAAGIAALGGGATALAASSQPPVPFGYEVAYHAADGTLVTV
jgi:ABC-type glycerol-3-phosphate transport system substrate-binding protein